MSSLDSHTMVPTATMLGRVAGPWPGSRERAPTGRVWGRCLSRHERHYGPVTAGTGAGHDPPKDSTSCESAHRYDARMTSSHDAGAPAQASTTDGVHRVSVLLYSDDITTRDAVRAAVGRRPARDVEIVSLARVRHPRGGHRGRWTPAASTSSSSTARRPRPAGSGLCRQLKNEIFHCPPILVLTGRPQDGWLADLVAGRRRRAAPARPDRRLRGRRGPGALPGLGRLTGVTTPTPAGLTWPDLLAALLRREDLTDRAGRLGDGPRSWPVRPRPAQIAGFLVALRAKGETVEELRGLADVDARARPPDRGRRPSLDVVGTGGDRLALGQHLDDGRDRRRRRPGVRVVKHGNRAASSSLRLGRRARGARRRR